MNQVVKTVARPLLRPFRGPITWACQRGYVSPEVKNFLPWRWAIEPFTIYGTGWKCRWFPTEFDAVGQVVFWSGLNRWERETAPVILDNIRRSRCFLDIGSNCGMYTVLGCTINPDVRVVAIEPVPTVCAALRNNVTRNNFDSRVTVLNVAVGETNGVVSFHHAEDATMSSFATEGYQGQRGNIIQVQCRTLDSIVDDLKIQPDFIKIDVEGFEDVVLAGAGAVLTRFRPRIVLEANPGDPADRVTAILSKQGYRFQIITDQGLQDRPAIVAEHAFRNWLCLPA